MVRWQNRSDSISCYDRDFLSWVESATDHPEEWEAIQAWFSTPTEQPVTAPGTVQQLTDQELEIARLGGPVAVAYIRSLREALGAGLNESVHQAAQRIMGDTPDRSPTPRDFIVEANARQACPVAGFAVTDAFGKTGKVHVPLEPSGGNRIWVSWDSGIVTEETWENIKRWAFAATGLVLGDRETLPSSMGDKT